MKNNMLFIFVCCLATYSVNGSDVKKEQQVNSVLSQLWCDGPRKFGPDFDLNKIIRAAQFSSDRNSIEASKKKRKWARQRYNRTIIAAKAATIQWLFLNDPFNVDQRMNDLDEAVRIATAYGDFLSRADQLDGIIGASQIPWIKLAE